MNGSLKTKLDILANSRDYYRCVICGCDKHIETHHIIPGIEKLANLVTLCHSCHKKAHGMAGCFKRGRYDKRRKHKLSKTDVMVIKNMLGVKHKQVYIAKVFKVSPRTISDIYNGNTWSYV